MPCYKTFKTTDPIILSANDPNGKQAKPLGHFYSAAVVVYQWFIDQRIT